MINLTLKGMNGSDMLVIQAAVVKVMERINFHPKEIDKELCEAPTEGDWLMLFVLVESCVSDLTRLNRELGDRFLLKIRGKSKNDIFLQVEAPKEEFRNLGRRFSYNETSQPRPFTSHQ